MKSLKKLPSVPVSRDVMQTLSGLSKAALIDCFVDAMAALEGKSTEELTDDEVRAFIAPRLAIRGDRPPRYRSGQ